MSCGGWDAEAFRAAADCLPCGICRILLDQDFLILSANDLYYQMCGYTRAQAEQAGFRSADFIVYPEDWPRVFQTVQKNVEEGIASFEVEHRITSRTGEIRWELARCQVDGDCLNCVLFDITDRKNLEELQRLSVEENRIAFQCTDQIMEIYDVEEKRLTNPPQAAELLGLPPVVEDVPDNIVAKGLISAESVKDYLRLFERMNRGVPTGGATIQMYSAVLGELHWYHLRYQMIFKKDGSPRRAVITCQDVTKQREKELTYQKWLQHFEQQKQNSIGYYEYDLTKDLFNGSEEDLPVNLPQGIRSFTGAVRYFAEWYVYEEDVGKYYAFYDREKLMGKFYAGKSVDRFEYRRKKKDGGFFWARGTVQLIPDPYTGNVKAFVLVQDIDAEKREMLKIRHRIERDELTGLLNRAASIEKITAILRDSGADAQHAFVMLDIDRFKRLNDSFGHQFGDQVLRECASAMTGLLCGNDLCGRMGGDEFVILLRDVPFQAHLESRLAQICAVLQRTYDEGAETSISIGAVYPCGPGDFEELYRRADAALYEAKRRGKNQFMIDRERRSPENFGAGSI